MGTTVTHLNIIAPRSILDKKKTAHNVFQLTFIANSRTINWTGDGFERIQ